MIDVRTGREAGDHGTGEQAIEFALQSEEPEVFLRSWQTGSLDEWPEFYIWLAKGTGKTNV